MNQTTQYKAFFKFMILTLAFLVGVAAVGHSRPDSSQQSAEDLYQAALLKKEAEGDLSGAIKMFQDIIKKFADNRAVAAKAQLHIGICYQKLGNEAAEKAFQKVIDEYPEQGEAIQEAREKLALLLRSRSLMETGNREFNIRQIWSGTGVDLMGAVSPDGRYLSFVDWMTGDLAIRELATGTNKRLTDKGSWGQSPEFALFSEWAPDSQRIVTQWFNKSERFELRVIDVNNSASRILYQCPEKNEYVQAFDWSPDGEFVLAVFLVSSAPVEDEVVQLGLISTEDGSVKIIKKRFETHPADPTPWGFAFSPDGQYIAYEAIPADSNKGRRDIFLISADGTRESLLIEHPADESVVDWTPDNKGLLFLSDRRGTLDLYFIRIFDGKPQGSPHLVKLNVGPIEPLGMTSRGTLCYGLQAGASDVYEVGIDPQDGDILNPARRAILHDEGHNFYPDYSSDGKYLAFISGPRYPGFQQQDILRIVSIETGQERELNPGLAKFGYPRWAPNGRAISLEGVDQEGRAGIYKVDVQTGGVVPIVHISDGMEIHSHRWSRDGKVMFYTLASRIGKTSSIFVHDFETGRDEKLTGSPDDANDIDISPDGKWLVFLNRQGQRVMRMIPTSGGEPREITSFGESRNHIISPAWSADGRFIYFSQLQSPDGVAWDLYRVAAEGGEAQKIDLSMVRFRHLTIHPDGQRIAFSSMGPNADQSEVWVMENFLPLPEPEKKSPID